jgi:hypothetical protein
VFKALFMLVSTVSAYILSDYVAAPEENFNWFEESDQSFKTLWGNTARILNVTSLKWMDETRA